jgi:hypothetical protein
MRLGSQVSLRQEWGTRHLLSCLKIVYHLMVFSSSFLKFIVQNRLRDFNVDRSQTVVRVNNSEKYRCA